MGILTRMLARLCMLRRDDGSYIRRADLKVPIECRHAGVVAPPPPLKLEHVEPTPPPAPPKKPTTPAPPPHNAQRENRAKKAWTPDEHAMCFQLAALGYDCAQIAQKLGGGRSRKSIYQRLYSHGRKGHPLGAPPTPRKKRSSHRPWSPAEEEILVDGIERGLPSKAIAEKLPGRSAGAVRTRRNKIYNDYKGSSEQAPLITSWPADRPQDDTPKYDW